MHKTDKIKLSIITSSFNSQNSIEETFKSILEQDYREFEYIVVDGASSDGTLDLIKHYEGIFKTAGIDFKWISEKDTGIYHAWNKGLKLASGDWIGFLGSDDQYYPNALIDMSQMTTQYPDADFICAKAKLMDKQTFIRPFGKAFSWEEFKREMKILHAGGLHNRQYFEQFGEFDEGFSICGDYELLLRKGKDIKVHFIDQYLVSMQIGGLSSANEYRALEEARLAKLKNKTQGKVESKLSMYLILLKIRLGKIKRALFGSSATRKTSA